MKMSVTWKENMLFDGEAMGNHVSVDAKAPLGKGQGMTPKELLGVGMVGCTAMDVIALLKKYKQPVESFVVSTEVTTSEPGKHPAVFVDSFVSFDVTGEVQPDKLIEAVSLSQTKYCGVSAMLAKAFPIRYRVLLNGQEIATGAAKFD